MLLLFGNARKAFLCAFKTRIDLKGGTKIVEGLARLTEGLVGLAAPAQGRRIFRPRGECSGQIIHCHPEFA